MSWLKTTQINLFIILSIIIFSLIVWFPTQNLPYHWDSAGFVINSARTLLNNNFNPLIVPDSDFAHPPLLIGLLALMWKLFGQSQLVSHLLMFPFLPIYLISIYYLAKKLFNLPIAIVTTIICATTPVVIAEYGLIYIDLPMAALTMLGLSLWVNKKYILSIIFLSLAALIKLPALGIVGGLVVWQLWKKQYKQIYYLLTPFISFGLWLIYHYQIENWWIARPNRLTNSPHTLSAFLKAIIFVSNNLFLEQGRLLVTVIFLLSITIIIIKKLSKKLKAIYLPVILLLISLFPFVTTGEYGARYGIFLYPLYYGVCIYTLFLVFQFYKIENKFIIISLIIPFLFFQFWHPKLSVSRNYLFKPSEDLSYQDMIKIGQQMSQFSQTKFPLAHFYGGFPESYQLTQPYQGYVNKELNFSQCPQFQLNTNWQQIIIYHPYSPVQINCSILLQQIVVVPLAYFEQNGKWVELYLVNATQSAKINKPPTN